MVQCTDGLVEKAADAEPVGPYSLAGTDRGLVESANIRFGRTADHLR